MIFFDFNVAFPANSVVFKARLIVRWKDCNEYYDIVYLNVENRFELNEKLSDEVDNLVLSKTL